MEVFKDAHTAVGSERRSDIAEPHLKDAKFSQ